MLVIRENEVDQLVTMPDAIEALTDAFRSQDMGGAANRPRERVRVPGGGGVLHMLGAALESEHVIGFKSYYSSRNGTRFTVMLFSAETGLPLCLIEADRLGQLRTGAATGVATHLMARNSAATVGVYGSGFQAQTQLEAICAVRSIKRAWVYSRTREKRERFATKLEEALGVEITATGDPSEVAAAEILVTATTSNEPVLRGEWLQPGTHINAVGANMLSRRELDDAVVRRATTVVTDSKEQAMRESMDLLSAIERGWLTWERVCELREIVSGARPARADEESVTLFKSLGIGLEDVALGVLIFRRALEQGAGEDVRFLGG